MPQHETNEMYRALEKTTEFSNASELIRKSLEDQWHDIVASGIINDLFLNYKRYFIQWRGKKSKVNKAVEPGTHVSTIEDLKGVEQQNLQENKLLLGTEALAIGALSLYLYKRLEEYAYSIGTYYAFRQQMRDYLKFVSNKAGQTIIEQITYVPVQTGAMKAIKFRLSRQEYLDKISERVDKLVKGLDQTTKDRMVSELVKGLELGETKPQMIARLSELGTSISESRAKRIVQTETQAIHEYMRFETARLNGVKVKKWITANDEKVCKICGPLHGTTISMSYNFDTGDEKASFTGKFPPAHASCRCWIEYTVPDDEFQDYIRKSMDPLEAISWTVTKAKEKTDWTFTPTGLKALPIVNPQAVWAGGESLVGKDKEVGNFRSLIMQDLAYEKHVANALSMRDGELLLDSRSYYPVFPAEKALYEARQRLTDAGFVQLMLGLGIRKKIPLKA